MRRPEELGPYLYRQGEEGFPLGEDTLRLAAEPAGEGWRITRWQLTAPWEPDTSLDVWTGQ